MTASQQARLLWWLAAGGAVGFAVAIVLRVQTGAPIVGPTLVLGLIGGVGVGLVATRRSRAPWVDLAPRAVVTVALLPAAVIGAELAGSLMVAGALTGLATAVAASAIRRAPRLELEGLVHAPPGTPGLARDLEALADKGWAGRRVRDEAAWQRARMALVAGAPAEAIAWFGRVRGERMTAHAAPWRALAYAALGRDDEARVALAPVWRGGDAIDRAWGDAVRVLLIYRGEGARAALSLADELAVRPEPVVLSVVRAAAHRDLDDREAADDALAGVDLAQLTWLPEAAGL